MNNKYYNDAIIGNKHMLISFSKKGEMLRAMYPSPDYKSFIDFLHIGVKINDSANIYLHDDINNIYDQEYVKDTNILRTKIVNQYFNLEIDQEDFVTIKDDILIKRYKFTNKNNINLNVDFLIYLKLLSNFNNMVSAYITKESMIQYSHDYAYYTFSKDKIKSYQINNNSQNINSGVIYDKDYIGMASDSSISYEIGDLKPGESKSIDIFMYIQNIDDLPNLSDMEEKIDRLKKIDIDKEEMYVKKYWNKYVEEHKGNFDIACKEKWGLQEESQAKERIKQIYNRSILLFPLLVNEETGGISASVEIDEQRDKCGRYAYCWPRDAMFITKALDLINMKKEVDKFYKIFCKNTQNRNGMWEQRFYTDGHLAPCWGYQIDETASVIYGANEHYKETKDIKFLKDILKMCENGINFLEKYLDQIFAEIGMKIEPDKIDVVREEILQSKRKTQEKNNDSEKIPVSYDLWEMHEGIHLYSTASIYGAMNSMIEIYNEIIDKNIYEKNRLRQEQIEKNKKKIEKYIVKIKEYVQEKFYDDHQKILIRNDKDQKTDISLIGTVVPFKMFSPNEKKVLNTVEKINMTLRTYTGGYLRFEQDHYMGGESPWPIATLWMEMYYETANNRKKAKECLEFVVNSATKHGFLGEQVNNKTMETNWVIGLGWSHAMFILAFLGEI